MQSLPGLLFRHGRTLGKIFGTTGYFHLAYFFVAGQVKVRTYIHYYHVHTGVTGQHISPGGFPHVAVHHLQRHFLGKGADAILGNPVIAAHQQHHRF